MFLCIVKREISLYIKQLGEVVNLLSMFVIASSFFIFSLPHGTDISQFSVAVLWVCALLVLAITQYRIFLADYEDGTLEQWRFLCITMELIVVAKGFAHWLMTALPLVLIVPLLMLLLDGGSSAGGTYDNIFSTMLALACGSLSFTFIGTIAAAISLRFGSKELLSSLIVLPISVPVLIFGSVASVKPFALEAEWLILLLYMAICVPVSAIASALLLQYAQE